MADRRSKRKKGLKVNAERRHGIVEGTIKEELCTSEGMSTQKAYEKPKQRRLV